MATIADPLHFDMPEWLPDEESVAEYLTIVMEENEPAALAKALGTIAGARGMSEIAANAGIGREALYRCSGMARRRATKRFRGCFRHWGSSWWRCRWELDFDFDVTPSHCFARLFVDDTHDYFVCHRCDAS